MLTTLLTVMALGTSGGPFVASPIGFDPVTQTLHLEGSAAANVRHASIPFEKGRPRTEAVEWHWSEVKPDERWLKCEAVERGDVTLTGKLVSQGMKAYQHPSRHALVATFTVDVELRWRSAKRTVRLSSWTEPTVELSGVWTIPTTRCVLVTLATRGLPYEGGYFEDSVHVVCDAR